MVMWIIQAWPKDTPATVPMAQCETRSVTLARDLVKRWKQLGFRVVEMESDDAFSAYPVKDR